MSSWPRVWQARWIWADEPAQPIPASRFGIGLPAEKFWNRFCYLRKDFDVAAVPEVCPARVTADSRYVLYVNGVEVSRGPGRDVPPRLAYESIDLAKVLRPGRNVVAALVRYYGFPAPWWRPAGQSGHLGLGSFAFEAPAASVTSDGSWKSQPAPYLQDAPLPFLQTHTEVLDGRLVPLGWTEASFDDSAWPNAVELLGGFDAVNRIHPPTEPFYVVEPVDIAALTADPIGLEVRGTGWARTSDGLDPLAAYAAPLEDGAARDPFVTYDVGRNTLATPWLQLRGAPAAIVDLYAGEDVQPDGRAEIAPRSYALRYCMRGGMAERVDGFEMVGFRYLTAVLRGKVEVLATGAVERRYPRGSEANFECDDERLNRIWETGARTLDLCSTDTFVDCPGREQRAFLGDTYVEALVAHVAGSDWRLIKRSLTICSRALRSDGLLSVVGTGDLSLIPTTIPEFSLHWIRTLARYFEYSGDLESARELLPVAMAIIASFERQRGADGLLRNLPGFVFIDWAQLQRAEVTGALDGLFAAALDDYAMVLELVLGDAEGARRARAGAQRTRTAFEILWDGKRGVYVDAVEGDKPLRRVSQHTNAAAIIGGCAPRERWPSMLDVIIDPTRVRRTATLADGEVEGRPPLWADPRDFDPEVNVVEAQPFFAHFLHQAMAIVGDRRRLLDLCLRWDAQIQRGNTTFEEYWEAKPGSSSRCHAASATPTYDLTTHILGVRPATLGYGRAIVSPFFGRLKRLSGRVPTPFGLIEIDVTHDGGRLVIPDGVTAEVSFDDADIGGGEYTAGRHVLTCL